MVIYELLFLLGFTYYTWVVAALFFLILLIMPFYYFPWASEFQYVHQIPYISGPACMSALTLFFMAEVRPLLLFIFHYSGVEAMCSFMDTRHWIIDDHYN